MKKIIDGKRYNTKTAIEVGNWNNGLGSSDLNNCDETLYKTKNGNYFIYGVGGAMTQWSEGNGRSTWGSSDIRALNLQEALEWIEQHNLDIPAGYPDLESLITEA